MMSAATLCPATVSRGGRGAGESSLLGAAPPRSCRLLSLRLEIPCYHGQDATARTAPVLGLQPPLLVLQRTCCRGFHVAEEAQARAGDGGHLRRPLPYPRSCWSMMRRRNGWNFSKITSRQPYEFHLILIWKAVDK